MEKNLNTTKPRYSEHIFPVPWASAISRFHCCQIQWGVTKSGYRELGMRIWERLYSGNSPENFKCRQRKRIRRHVYGCKLEFQPTVPLDHVTITFLLEQSPIGTGMNKALNGAWPGKKIESVLSYATPIGQYKTQTADWVQCRLRIKTVSRLIRDDMWSVNMLCLLCQLYLSLTS